MNRHDLIYLDYVYCKNNIGFLCKEEDEEIILDWIKNENPLMITRQLSSNTEKTDVGFMLPLSKNKKRFNFTIYNKSIGKRNFDIKLKNILSSLELKWRKPLLELVEDFEEYNLDIFLFGSTIWQYLTKEQYMHIDSDIDILWKPQTSKDLENGLFILKKWMSSYSLKIDGEVILPCKNACSWKELLNDDKNVLIKNLHYIYLESKEIFLNSLRKN